MQSSAFRYVNLRQLDLSTRHYAEPYINRQFSGRVARLLDRLFGLFLTPLGIYAIFLGVIAPFTPTVFGLLIAALGAETMWYGIRAKQSWFESRASAKLS